MDVSPSRAGSLGVVLGLIAAVTALVAGRSPEPAPVVDDSQRRLRPAVAVAPVPVRLPEARAGSTVVGQGDGRFAVVGGTSAPAGSGTLRRYTVAVEGALGIDGAHFAAEVAATLGDPRSWIARGRASFQRVSSGTADFRVVLASPRTTDRLCAPLETRSSYSCGVGDLAVVNSLRWLRGASAYDGRLKAYRAYVVNHEVGHVLGHGHARCPGPGKPAPVMMQQTKGVGGCRAQPWPFP